MQLPTFHIVAETATNTSTPLLVSHNPINKTFKIIKMHRKTLKHRLVIQYMCSLVNLYTICQNGCRIMLFVAVKFGIQRFVTMQ